LEKAAREERSEGVSDGELGDSPNSEGMECEPGIAEGKLRVRLR
jgi:hypothetical protein